MVSAEPNVSASSIESDFQVSERYRLYVAWLLGIVYLFNQVDRQIFAILQQPIKEAFQFSDGQLGLIGGTAFGLFYATLAVPIGRLADRRNRVKIITLSLTLWSLFTALTGWSRNFLQMLGARMIVGIGEAGCSPSAFSILSDYFESKRRATAIAIYSLGASGGSIVGLLVGSKVAEVYGWRTAFFAMGLPGILLAIVVRLTLREPPRGLSDRKTTTSSPPAVLPVLKKLLAKRSFVYLTLAAACYSIAANGIGAFYSVFLIRSHHLSLSMAGRWLAIASLGGLAGTFLCGKLADVLSNRSRDVRWLLWTPAFVLLINLPFGLLLYTTTDKNTAFTLLVVSISLGSAYLAPTIATTQRLVGAHERALSSAILFFVMSFVGLTLGPWLAGHLSDTVKDHFLTQGVPAAQASADGLRFAFMCLLVAPVLAAAFYFLSARTVREEIVE